MRPIEDANPHEDSTAMTTLPAFLLALMLPSALAAPLVPACPGPQVYTTAASVTLVSTAAGDTIPFGGLTLHGVEPEEIDLRSECAPTIVVEGLTLRGVEPDEIDLAADGTLDIAALTGEVHTSGHLLLGAAGRRGVTTTTGTLVLAPLDAVLREEVVSLRPYASVLVLDVRFELVDVVPDDGRTEAVGVIPAGTTVTAAADALYPEQPICAHCGAD